MRYCAWNADADVLKTFVVAMTTEITALSSTITINIIRDHAASLRRCLEKLKLLSSKSESVLDTTYFIGTDILFSGTSAFLYAGTRGNSKFSKN